jgi:uncharacterized FlaG/YvyC family protein
VAATPDPAPKALINAPDDPSDLAAEYMIAEDMEHVLVRLYNRRTGATIRTIPPTLMVSVILKALGVKSISRLDRLV